MYSTALISLEELSQRHPDVEKDVNQISVEVAPPPTPQPSGGSGSGRKGPILRIIRDTLIGLFVGFVILLVSQYLPFFPA